MDQVVNINASSEVVSSQISQTLLDGEIKELIEEARSRIINKLSEVESVFNRAIGDLTRFRDFLLSLANKYGNTSENIKAFADAIDAVVKYVYEVKEYWLSHYGEAIKMLEKSEIRRGKTSVTVAEYASGLTIIIGKVPRTVEIIIKMPSISISVPTILRWKTMLSILLGLMNSDGSVHQGHAEMTTVYTWQSCLWFLLFPNTRMNIRLRLNNKKGVRLVWKLASTDDFLSLIRPVIDGIVSNKIVISWPLLILGALLGDGYISLRKGVEVGITGNDLSYLPPLFPHKHKNTVAIYGAEAIDFLKKIYNELSEDQIFLDLLKFMASFSDAEKLRRFFKVINLQDKPRKPYRKYSVQTPWGRFTLQVGYKWLRLDHNSTAMRAEEMAARMNDYFIKHGIAAVAKRTGSHVMLGTRSIRSLVAHGLINVNELLQVLCRRLAAENDEKKIKAIKDYIMEFARFAKPPAQGQLRC